MMGAALVLALVGRSSNADVITFGEQDVDELHLAGTRTEGAFQYEATGVAWELVYSNPALGNPSASLATVFNGDGPALGDTVDIRATGSGFFTFQSVDFRTLLSIDSHNVTLTGFAGGVSAGVLTLSDSATTFQTVPSGFVLPIDLLRIELVGPLGGNALFLDNLVVSPVPEPATLLLAAIALALPRRPARRKR
jgi:hypothetical protein